MKSVASLTPVISKSPVVSSRLLLLGLGNDILTDDAIGLLVVRQLQSELAGHSSLDVAETSEMGLALLDFLTGYSEVIIVDAIQTGRVPPGFVHELNPDSLKQLTGRTPHFLGVGETLSFGRDLGLVMPQCVKIFAVEVEDPFTVGTEMTPALQTAFPSIVAQVAAAVHALAWKHTEDLRSGVS